VNGDHYTAGGGKLKWCVTVFCKIWGRKKLSKRESSSKKGGRKRSQRGRQEKKKKKKRKMGLRNEKE